MKMQDRNIANAVFCERLALLTTRASLIQMQLCDIAKISQGAIIDYLKGKSEPKAEALYRLSRAFSVTMEWLWGIETVTAGSETTATPISPLPSARETLLESKLRMATSALASILKELKKK
ncbi:MAG: helix-turn-helix transcriptional regulator [Akkermansia sp.]|nr:helix-turn-helix transcriptional regulator [Akkermansia sp.]